MSTVPHGLASVSTGIILTACSLSGQASAQGETPPADAAPVPAFEVEDTTVQQLPDQTVTIHRVKDPGLQPLPEAPPPQPLDPNDPLAAVWLARAETYRQTHRSASLSATVYDHQRTLLQWHVGEDPETRVQYEAWSNIDFSHLSAMSSIQQGGITWLLLMSVTNIDTAKLTAFFAGLGKVYQAPAAPPLPEGEAAYVLTKGDGTNPEALAAVEELHAFYRIHQAELAAAYQARLQQQQAHPPSADPPPPEDITIHFWRGEREEGGQ